MSVVDRMIERFDYHHALRVMWALDWKWDVDGGRRIPTEQEMKQNARELLEWCERSDSFPCSMGTGGFRATAFSKTSLFLDFIPTSIDSEDAQ